MSAPMRAGGFRRSHCCILSLWVAAVPAGSVALGQASPGAARFQPPAARYRVDVERSLMVPMRDGVRLATDLYRPADLSGPLPVILIRTPYGKRQFHDEVSLGTYRFVGPYIFASQGYMVAVQDTRGRFESEGLFTINAHESEDGYDAIEWLSRQAWSNGRVGTFGCSYMGETQIQAARLRHPRHAAAIAQGAGGAMRYGAFLMGGALELSTAFGWFLNNGAKFHLKPPRGVPPDVWAEHAHAFTFTPRRSGTDYRAQWRTLPVVGMVSRAGGLPSDFDDFASRPMGDPWWERFGYAGPADRFDLPTLHVNSWYDIGAKDTGELFNLFRTNAVGSRGRDHQYLIMSPTSHCLSEFVTAPVTVGELDVGDPELDYWDIYLRWFDYWLRDGSNRILSMSRVRLYVMGRNEWQTEQEWPLARTAFTDFFLRSDGRANSRHGTGRLSEQPPAEEPPDRFTYDPATPVPSIGGPVCCTGTPDAPEGAFDQSEVETRHDVLVYSSEPLGPEGLEVTGPISLVLHVSSSARDTDFTGKLVDVHPDGRAYNVQEGILRARYRDGFGREVFMQPGKVYEIRIDLQATSYWFKPGHRVRLEVSSSNFPRFDRNLNTGGRNPAETRWQPAHNVVWHTGRYPSRLILPVIPARARIR